MPSSGTRVMASGSLVDYADPAAPRLLGTAPFSLSVWPAFQWPYLYNTRTYDTDGRSSPLTIIDYSTPSAARQVKSIDAVSLVGFTTGTSVVVGNLLLVASGDVYTGVSAWDIGEGDYAHFQNGYMFGSRLDGGKWIKYDIAARKVWRYRRSGVLEAMVVEIPEGIGAGTVLREIRY